MVHHSHISQGVRSDSTLTCPTISRLYCFSRHTTHLSRLAFQVDSIERKRKMAVLYNQSGKSSSIPVPRSPAVGERRSEIRDLEEHSKQMQIYEVRDDVMYHRLINGMLLRCNEAGYCSSMIQDSVMSVMRTHATPIPASNAHMERGVASGSSRGSDAGGWFLCDRSWKEQLHEIFPGISRSEECPTPCSLEGSCRQETRSCPTFSVELEHEDVRSDVECAEEAIFELDL